MFPSAQGWGPALQNCKFYEILGIFLGKFSRNFQGLWVVPPSIKYFNLAFIGWVMELRGFNLGCAFSPKFAAPLAANWAKLYVGCNRVFEVQECY